MSKIDDAAYLAGVKKTEGAQSSAPTNVHVISGEVIEDSSDGQVSVVIDGDIFTSDSESVLSIDTLGGLSVGDTATIMLAGETGRAMVPLAIGAPGSIDRLSLRVNDIEADYVKASTLDADVANIGYLKADDAVITNLQANDVTINNRLTAAEGNIDTLEANDVTINGRLTAAEGNIDTLEANDVTINGRLDASEADIDDLQADTANISDLVATKANITDLTAATGRITSLETDNVAVKNRLTATEADIDNLQADTADISDLVAKKATITDLNAATARIGTIESDYLKAADMTAEQARVGTLLADKADITDLSAATARIDDLEADHVSVEDFEAEQANIDNLQAATADIETIRANSAKVQNLTAAELEADHATVGNLTATYATIDSLDAAEGRIGTLEANDVTITGRLTAAEGNITTLNTSKANVTDLTAATGRITDLESTRVRTSDLEANYITADTIESTYTKTDFSNTDVAWIQNGVIKDGSISSAMINSVSANKLTAGTINGSVINVTNLNADNITAGTINGQRIGEGSLSLDKLSEDVYTEAEVDAKLSTMQSQIDGAIETWTGTVVPTLQNSPASSWNTTALKDSHVGDVYFVVNSQSQQNGYNYRFTKSGSTYSWQLIKDSDVTNALQRISTAEGKITTFDSDISQLKTDTGTLTTKTTSLETRMSDAEADILDKVDTTTFNEVSDTVDSHSQSISQMSTTLSNKADSSTVSAVTQRVSKNEQDISGINTTIGQLQTTVESKADGSTVSTISNKLNTVSDTVDGHTQSISSITSTQTTMQGKLDKTLVETTQLWFSKANTTAPNKPTAQVTSTSTEGNAWRVVVPAYNASYPNYYYCYQWKYSDGTYGWSSVTRDIAMGESQERARTAITNAAAADTKAGNAASAAATAQSTADTANSNASAAVSTANTANSNASTALSTANTAAADASDAKTDAATAVSTANTASSNASTALSTANTASSNASTAVSTANTAKSTADTAKATADKNVKSTTQLWYTKANETAPSKPTAKVTSTAVSGNGWRVVVPTYASDYPYYFYCYQYELADGTFTWSDVVYDRATTENQANSRSAVTGVSTLTTKTNDIQDTVDGHTQSLQSITQTQTTIQQNAVKSTVQLWFTKADTTAPAKPTAHVTTNNAATGNAWNLAVPTYNASYPNYYYCYEYQYVNGSYGWSAVTRDIATGEMQATARQAQADIDGLEIGGRNLLLWSGDANHSPVTRWGSQNNVTSKSYDATYDAFKYITPADSGNNNNGMSIYSNNSVWLNEYGRSQIANEKTYTFSIDVMGTLSSGNPMTMKVFYSSPAGDWNSTPNPPVDVTDKVKSDGFTRVSATFTLPSNRTEGTRIALSLGAKGATFYVKNPKLELGNRATDWSPAPEDVDADISTAQTSADNAQATANKNVKESQQLWFTKANGSAPNKPSAKVTSTSTGGNAWTTKVPTYNASYPHYFYCMQYIAADGTVTWSDVVYDQATTEAQSVARTASANLTTLQQDYATFKQTTQNFESTIGTTYATKTELQTTDNKIDNLEIGGRNLLKGTSSYASWDPTNSNWASDFTATDEWIKFTPRYRKEWLTVEPHDAFIPIEDWDTAGRYTLSFDIKFDNRKTDAVYPRVAVQTVTNKNAGYAARVKEYSVAANPSTDEWTHFEYTFDGDYSKWISVGSGTAAYVKVVVWLYIDSSEADAVYIRRLKLEKGTKATDWTPAPEDVDAAIDKVDGKTSVRLHLRRDSWTDAQWGAYASVGHADSLANVHYASGGSSSATGFDATTLNVGDLIVIEGISTGTNIPYSATAKVTSVPNSATGNIPATVISANNAKAIESRVSTAETSITQNKNDIALRAKSSDVYTKTQVDGKITQEVSDRNSAIEQSASAINLSVSQTYTTKTEFNNLEIGGRNLLRHTTHPELKGQHSQSIYDTDGWYVWGAPSDFSRTNEGIKGSFNSNGTGFVIPFVNDDIVSGETDYVFSFDARGTFTGPTTAYALARSGSNWQANELPLLSLSETEWTHVEIPVKWPSFGDRKARAILYPYNNTTGKWIEIRDSSAKFEKGNKATDWTPAPEDMVSQTEFESAKSEIKATTDGITSTVSKISSAKYLDTTYSGYSLTELRAYSSEGYTGGWQTTDAKDAKKGDTVYLRVKDTTRNCYIYVKATVNTVSGNYLNCTSHGYEDVLPVDTIKSTINQSSDSVKIQARHVEIDGAAIFSNTAFKAAADAAYDAKGSASAVQTNLDNLEIGGRNFLLNTENPTALKPPKPIGDEITWQGSAGGTLSFAYGVMKFTSNSTSGEHFVRLNSPSHTQRVYESIGVDIHDSLVLSGFVRASMSASNATVTVRAQPSTGSSWINTITLKNLRTGVESTNTSNVVILEGSSSEWVRFEVSIYIPESVSAVNAYFSFQQYGTFTVGDTIEFKRLKLERGSRATDWTPAPEDVNADIFAAEASAKEYADGLPAYKIIATDYSYSLDQWTAYAAEGHTGSWTQAGPVKVNDTVLIKGTNRDTGGAIYVLITVNVVSSSGMINNATSHGLIDPTVGQRLNETYEKIRSQGIQLVTNGNGFMGDNTNWPSLTFDGSKANGSPGSFTRGAGNYTVLSNEMFPIDISKEYLFEFDAMSDGGTGRMYSFLSNFDVDKNEIFAQNVMYYPNTLTTLAQDLNPGDTTIKLTSATNWVDTNASHQRSLVFWDYSNAYGYTYAPETYSRHWYENVYADNSKVNKSTGVITLSSPWAGPKKVAGTYVSQNHSGSTYDYAHINIPIPSTWTHYSRVISGLDLIKDGDDSIGKFRQGTAFAKVGFLWNNGYSSTNPQGQIWITNISVKEATATKSELDSVATTANNAAPKSSAVTRTQRIYYRKSASGAPGTPGSTSSAWVSQTGNVSNAWTTMHVPISSTEKFIYTCEQRQFGDGNIAYTSVLLDNTITVIDGGNIITGSVTANQIAAGAITAQKLNIGDTANYSQLDDSTASYWGFTADTTTDGHWYTMNTIGRDKFVSGYYDCKGGEKFKVSFEISTTCKGHVNNTATTDTYLGTAVGIYCYNDGHTASAGIYYSVRTTATSSGTATSISSEVGPINTAARQFRIFIQTEGSNNFSGTIKIRNLKVYKMTGGELIVDGSVKASAISATSGTFNTANIPDLNASKITAGDISAARIKANVVSAIQAVVTDLQALVAKIGGFTLDATSIRTAALTSNADNSIGLSTADFTRTINGTSRAGLRMAFGDKFGVTGDGTIFASSANVSGTITATAGTIGGASISNGVLKVKDANIDGTISGSHIDASSISIGSLNGASNYATKDDAQGYANAKDSAIAAAAKRTDVSIAVTAINYDIGTATLQATLYVDGTATTSNVTYKWLKDGSVISGQTARTLSVTAAMGLSHVYSCTVTYS